MMVPMLRLGFEVVTDTGMRAETCAATSAVTAANTAADPEAEAEKGTGQRQTQKQRPIHSQRPRSKHEQWHSQ